MNAPIDLATLDLDSEIRRLKRERNAVLLAHYYQDSEIQDVADFIGDSLQLAQEAKRTQADVILFAGVHFMAETAKILNPERTVLVPDMAAGCSLADGCPADRFRAWRARYPGAVAISYINCSAAVKAESDIICTSSNAEKIVRSIPADQQILFAPDRNLGRYLIKKTGRDMVLWPGSCIVHETFSLRKLVELQQQHPEAKVIAHPECEEPLLDMADFIGSTAALLRFVQNDPASQFIVVTESGILHQMKKVAPEKIFLALRDLQPELQMDDALRVAAKKPIERMLELS